MCQRAQNYKYQNLDDAIDTYLIENQPKALHAQQQNLSQQKQNPLTQTNNMNDPILTIENGLLLQQVEYQDKQQQYCNTNQIVQKTKTKTQFKVPQANLSTYFLPTLTVAFRPFINDRSANKVFISKQPKKIFNCITKKYYFCQQDYSQYQLLLITWLKGSKQSVQTQQQLLRIIHKQYYQKIPNDSSITISKLKKKFYQNAYKHKLIKCECGNQHNILQYNPKDQYKKKQSSKVVSNRIVPMIKQRADILKQFHLRINHQKIFANTVFFKNFYDHNKTHYYWNGILQDYKQFVKNCAFCFKEANQKIDKIKKQQIVHSKENNLNQWRQQILQKFRNASKQTTKKEQRNKWMEILRQYEIEQE